MPSWKEESAKLLWEPDLLGSSLFGPLLAVRLQGCLLRLMSDAVTPREGGKG